MLQSKLKEGQKVICTIDNQVITDAKVHREHGFWYICQNVIEGITAGYTLGYDYSWQLSPSRDEIEHNADVEDFIVLNKRKRKFSILKYKP